MLQQVLGCSSHKKGSKLFTPGTLLSNPLLYTENPLKRSGSVKYSLCLLFRPFVCQIVNGQTNKKACLLSAHLNEILVPLYT